MGLQADKAQSLDDFRICLLVRLLPFSSGWLVRSRGTILYADPSGASVVQCVCAVYISLSAKCARHPLNKCTAYSLSQGGQTAVAAVYSLEPYLRLACLFARHRF